MICLKALIWFLCIFVLSLFTTFLKTAGIMLGAIPTVLLYGVTVWFAKLLTKHICGDSSDDDDDTSLTECSKTYHEIEHRIPQAVKDYCKSHAQEPEKIRSYLNTCASDHLISKAYIPAIVQEFTARPSAQQTTADVSPAVHAQPAEDTVLDDVLAHCSAIAHDYKQLESYIISCITSGKIDCETASQIWKAYYNSQK